MTFSCGGRSSIPYTPSFSATRRIFTSSSEIDVPRVARATTFLCPPNPAGSTLFIDGNPFHLPADMMFAAELMCKSSRMSCLDLGPMLEGPQGEKLSELMHELLREGYLYPADD